jgi:hypothetical protein
LTVDQKWLEKIRRMCFSPSLSVDRCWKSEMLVPWKEVVAVVAVGLWSMLSIAAVVNNPFLMTAGQTRVPELPDSFTNIHPAFSIQSQYTIGLRYK